MESMVLNESFKALVEKALPDKRQSEIMLQAFVEVVNDRATTQRIGLDELKSRAIDEIRQEFVTKGFLEAKLSDLKNEMKFEIAQVKIDIIKWVVGLQFASVALIVGLLKLL